MKRKNFERIISALLLLLVSAVSLLPATAYGEATVREILSGFAELTPVEGTPYLLAKKAKGNYYGLYNTDGEQLIPFAYEDLYYVSSNCFGAVKEAATKQSKYPTLEEINSHAIVTADGTQVSDFLYGHLEAFSSYWACGWVLVNATDKDYDLKTADDFYYRIKRCDFFFLGDHALTGKKGTDALPTPLSLSREEYKSAVGHGKFLYVQDREDQIKIFDSQLNLVNVPVESLDDSMYVIRNYSVALQNTADILFDGFIDVKEVQTDGGLLLNMTRLDYSGSKWSTVFTAEGEQMMPLVRGEIETLTKDYAVLNINKKRGLYSFREQKLLVPCAFQKLIANNAAVYPDLQHGYVSVQKGGEKYYFSIADGMLYESTKPAKKWQKLGNVYVLNDAANARYRILAPDQQIANLKKVKPVENQNAGTGYLLSVYSETYEYMLVTWHGEIVLKGFLKPFTLTCDDKAIIQKKDGTYSLLEVKTKE